MKHAEEISPFRLASVLLAYPTMALFEGSDELDRVARTVSPRAARDGFLDFLSWLRNADPNETAEHYVATFDLRRRCALYLTYYRYGDTRKRGMAMITFKTAYRTAGFTPTEDELPDYLPMVLEFAALSPKGGQLLYAHRTDLELLRRGLTAAESPYAHLLEAVCALLPKLGRRELIAVRTAWDSGPPKEDVGLEPFAPPEYLSGQEVRA